MRVPKALYVLFVVALVGGLLPLTVAARPAAQAPIEADLLAQLEEGPADFFVRMSVQADLSAAYGMDWAARGQYVYDSLREVARVTQAPVIEYAVQHNLEYTSYFNGNEVYIRGGELDAALDLAALPGVGALYLERLYYVDPIIAGGAAPEYTKDWGLTDINADDVWALGYEGAGIKVANIDTGVQYNHPALDQAFACPGAPSDPKCWKDPANICGGSACDNNGHGTHTMGTMVGDNDPGLTYWVGMAPDATWIACKGCESNSCSDSSLNACADWILAPGGNANNRPNVVNNSWGGGGGDTWYLTKVNNWRAAGIFPAFSAGNSGPGCNSLGSPGDYQQSFASAAHTSSRTIASYSSRGPSSAFGHDPYTKPNISAPGSSICSSVPTNGWNCGYSGTSMASPHSAGAVALVWQACPSYLGQIDATFELLQDNADTPPAGNCSAPPDGEGNYTYGYGFLNALAAVQACAGGCVPVSNAAFTWAPASPFAGQAVTFTGSASGTAPIGYAWTFGDGGTGSGATVAHTYTAAGTYTVSMTATNECGSQTVQNTVTVLPPGEYTLHLNGHQLVWSTGLFYYKFSANIRVHDQNHAVAEGVTVSGRWTKPDGTTVDQQAVTNSAGVTQFQKKFAQAGTYKFCVIHMTKAGYTYNPAANEARPCKTVTVP